MSPEKEELLYNRYSDLYSHRHLPASESCMCWGFECGDGWFDLIDELSKSLVKLDPAIRVGQVKEKYGGLRFYLDKGASDENLWSTVDDLIDGAEAKSYEICEGCGSENNVTIKNRWVGPICEDCHKK